MSLNETENSKETNNIQNDDIVLSNVMISEPNEKNGNKKLQNLEDHKNDFKENQKEENLDNENYFSEIKQKLQNLD